MAFYKGTNRNEQLGTSFGHKKVACLVMVIFPDNEPSLTKGAKKDVGERDVWVYKGDLCLGDY
jgi:hypothetical protein